MSLVRLLRRGPTIYITTKFLEILQFSKATYTQSLCELLYVKNGYKKIGTF